jgi:MoaA/NifB/PqqE/SkfB family radical SAM enzyme
MSLKLDFHDKFRSSFHNWNRRQDFPIKVALEITHRCNLKCVHCYTRGNGKDKELSFEQIDKILKEIHSRGCLWVLLTGGEPLLRKDFIEIYLKIKEYGFLPVIFTNATLINEKIARLFAEYKPLFVEVSLYALGENRYKEITRVNSEIRRSTLTEVELRLLSVVHPTFPRRILGFLTRSA